MPKFAYRGRDEQGLRVRGYVQADSQAAAIEELRSRGYSITALKAVLAARLPVPRFGARPMSSRDLATICQQISTMLEAGVTLMGSLDVLVRQTTKTPLKRLLAEVRADLEAGRSLAEALEERGRAIPSIMVNTVRAGEAGGNLPAVFNRLASHFEREHEMASKIRSAMAYPKVIGLVATAVLAFMAAVVVPAFADLFSGLGVDLPVTTRIVLGGGTWLRAHWSLVVLTTIMVVVLYFLARRNQRARRAVDWVALRVPVFGPISVLRLLSRFCRTLASLLTSGVHILDALSVSSRTVDNTIVAGGIMRAREAVREGHSIVEPLKAMREFDPMALEMLAVGEESGEMEEMLLKVAEMFDAEMERRVQQMTALIEPALIIVLGGMVGFIMISIFLPMLDILEHIS